MKPEWIAVVLVAVGMAAQVLLTIDSWVHGRASSERTLGRDVEDLKRTITEMKQAPVDGGWARRIGKMELRLERIDEHLRNTDADVEELKRHRPGRGSA